MADGYTYPADEDVIGVSLDYVGESVFRVRIENRSTVGTLTTSTMEDLAVPLAPQ